MPAPHLFSWLRRGDEQASCRTALSRQPSLEDAVSEVVDQLNAKGFGAAARGEADLALVFSSTSYASDLPRLLPLLRSRLRSRHWLGAAGGGVVGTGASGTAHEVEQESALSVMLLRLPGAELQLFGLATDQLPDLESAVDWLRSLLRSRGHELPGGSVVLTGGLVAPTPLPAGGWDRARFSHPRSPHETIVVEAHRPGRNPT